MLVAKLKFSWRWCATAFSFFIFGVGGVLIPLVVVPILYLLPGNHLVRERRGQKFIHLSFRAFIGMMSFLGVLTYKVSDLKKLQHAKLILANHPSLLDVVFLISLVPNANCVVKAGLIRNPFMRGPIKAAGYIVNDGDADDVLVAAADAFDKGHALIIFPEGTRTTPSQLIQLKRGAANVAIRTGVDITPVLITCFPTTLTKNDRWYQIPKNPMHFEIKVKEKIAVSPYLSDLNYSRGARALTHDLTTYFNNKVELNE